MFLPVVSRSVVKHFFGSFSKVEVSASVGDSKTTRLHTPQANFLKKQFSYINDSFQFFFWIQKLNLILLLTLDNISFPRWVRTSSIE